MRRRAVAAKPDALEALLEALGERVTQRLRSAYLQGTFQLVTVRRDVIASVSLEPHAVLVRMKSASSEAREHLLPFIRTIIGEAPVKLEARL